MQKRVYLIDALRGIAIVGMVIHHFLYDIETFLDKQVPVLQSEWLQILLTFGAGIFICISGMSMAFSGNNLKRGCIILAFGMIVSIITSLLPEDQAIYFGILHLLGISVIITHFLRPVLNRVPPYLITILFGVLFAIGYYIYAMDITVSQSWLFPLGFTSKNFISADYFPLMPWLFLFIAGTGLGRLTVQQKMPKWFYRVRLPFLEYIGRKTLWIYILHQPVLLCIMFIIKYTLN